MASPPCLACAHVSVVTGAAIPIYLAWWQAGEMSGSGTLQAPQGVPDHEPTSDDQPDDVVVLPWWQSKLNLVSLAVAIALLAGGLGWVIGNNTALPDPGPADTGFLQDMRWHHEQAVEMANIYLVLRDTDQRLATIAREITLGQAIEIGQMVQLLRSFGAPETNETETAMTWMNMAVAIDAMPGLATEEQLDEFVTLSGDAADKMFVDLMVAHHQGGIHMAEAAIKDARVPAVRKMAEQMARSQQFEIDELQDLLTR
jgi:uncharacterized protein (DUF305 family)